MVSYFYPTQSGWFEGILEAWKNSGKRTLSFPFLWFNPTTLPTDQYESFWMYLYYTETSTEDSSLKRVVKFRARVIRHTFSIIHGESIHTYEEPDAKVWFQCDLVEEIRDLNGNALRDTDFEHLVNGVALLQAVRNSIAPVKRVTPMVTVQSTWCCIND